MLHAVILLDELATSDTEAMKMKSKLKSLINPNQAINPKFRNIMRVELNNYIVVASNEQVTCVPVLIEEDDRRYCIISGGKDKNLQHEAWFNFAEYKEQLPALMLYLLSRPIDIAKAATPLLNEKKRQLMGLSEDFRVTVVREWLDSHPGGRDDLMTGKQICDAINETKLLRMAFTGKRLAPIMRSLGFEPETIHNQFWYRRVSSVERSPEDEKGQAWLTSGETPANGGIDVPLYDTTPPVKVPGSGLFGE